MIAVLVVVGEDDGDGGLASLISERKSSGGLAATSPMMHVKTCRRTVKHSGDCVRAACRLRVSYRHLLDKGATLEAATTVKTRREQCN